MLLTLAAAVLLSGCCNFCKCCKPPGPGPVDPPVCEVPILDESSVVIHDPEALAVPFRFERTLEQIIAESGFPGSTTPAALLQTLLDSFNETSFMQPHLGKPIDVDQRSVLAMMPAAEMLKPFSSFGMVPVALFNRFDLAPEDGSNCGEYRIVYAMTGSGPFFIIFESRLPNPAPASGIAGCKPVADFWAARSKDPDLNTRVAHLESFYYVGLPADGFDAVVRHANYGLPLGQVRTNFLPGGSWMLREHRTGLSSTSVPIFVSETVKDSPLAEWFRVSTGLPAGVDFDDQKEFRNDFLNEPICNLTRPERAEPAATAFDIVNGIGAGFSLKGDDFQSVSDDGSDDPSHDVESSFSDEIANRLTALGAGTVDSQSLLNRAGAMTCGGCHQFSNGRPLNVANTVHWPDSGGFVHVNENGDLSTALLSTFLPRRQQILARFICDPTAEPVATAPCPAPPSSDDIGSGSDGGSEIMASPLPPAEGIDEAVLAKLRRGRAASYFQEVDAARASLLAAAARRAKASDAKSRRAAEHDMKRASQILETTVLRARAEERALPGAFTSVRRTH